MYISLLSEMQLRCLSVTKTKNEIHMLVLRMGLYIMSKEGEWYIVHVENLFYNTIIFVEVENALY